MPLTTKSNSVSLLFLSLTLSATSACVTDSTAPAPVNGYCAVAKPIGYDSKNDTPETVKAIEEHNSKWMCICENDCPKPR